MKVLHVLLFAALVLPACGEPESEFDRLIGRMCARWAQSDFLNAVRTSEQTREPMNDQEYAEILFALDELGYGDFVTQAKAMVARCPETYWEVQTILVGIDLRENAQIDRLAMRACARLREPAVAAWLEGRAGAEADAELAEIFQAGWQVEGTERLFEGALGVHCPEKEAQIEAAIRVVSGGWEMVRARLRARETCATLEHALGQRESARAGALALAWKSEVADLGRVDRVTAELTWAGQPPDPIPVAVLRRALEERCPEAAAAVSALPG